MLILPLSAPLSATSTLPELTRIQLSTHLGKRLPSSPTRWRLGINDIVQSRTFRWRVHRCRCSATPVDVSSQVMLMDSKAYWVSQSLIAWNVEAGDGSCYLYASGSASLSAVDNGIKGYDVKVKLDFAGEQIPEPVIEKFPHLRDYKAYNVPSALDAKGLLKCQLVIAIFSSAGYLVSATGLQLPGVIDELFSYTGPLGAVFTDEAVTLHLWAPTAKDVHALIYDDPCMEDPLEIVQLEEMNGVWTANGPKLWEGCYYVYEVSVYHPSTYKIERCLANDPYARGLSANGKRTLLVNIDSDALKPEGWDNLAEEKPNLFSFSDISIYELHIRDFSASDYTVDPNFRGGYLAFTSQDSAGIHHLKKLSGAGITHIHLLPAFQFSGVEDEKDKWKSADLGLSQL